MQADNTLNLYRRIVVLFFLAFMLHVGLVSYDLRPLICPAEDCAAPLGLLIRFGGREIPLPEFGGSVEGVSGLYARGGVPVWLGWTGGIILPAAFLIYAVYLFPARPWQKP